MAQRFGFVSVVLLLACGGQTLDLGSKPAGSSASSSYGGGGSGSQGEGATGCLPQPGVNTNGGSGTVFLSAELPPWPSASTCEPVRADLQGQWSGYVQAATRFPDNGNVTLSVGTAGASACGTITFGEAASYPAPDDPKAFYPQGWDRTREFGILPGYAYQLLGTMTSDTRWQFRVGLHEPWRGWCQLQTPVCSGRFGGYQCQRTMNWIDRGDGTCVETGNDGRELAELACAQAYFCQPSSLCLCTRDACDTDPEVFLAFDFHIEGDTAEGQVDQHMVYLKKAPSGAE